MNSNSISKMKNLSIRDLSWCLILLPRGRKPHWLHSVMIWPSLKSPSSKSLVVSLWEAEEPAGGWVTWGCALEGDIGTLVCSAYQLPQGEQDFFTLCTCHGVLWPRDSKQQDQVTMDWNLWRAKHTFPPYRSIISGICYSTRKLTYTPCFFTHNLLLGRRTGLL